MKSCVLSVKVPIKRNAEKQTAIQKTHQYVQSNSAKYTKIESTKDASKRVSCQAPSWGPRRWSHGSSRTVREWVARSCNSKIPSGSLCSAANYVKLPKEVKLRTFIYVFLQVAIIFLEKSPAGVFVARPTMWNFEKNPGYMYYVCVSSNCNKKKCSKIPSRSLCSAANSVKLQKEES